MFISSTVRDFSNPTVTVNVDNHDNEWPITLAIFINGTKTEIYMNRNQALEIMSKLEKAVHETAEKETL
jgi:hypothetical protein